jgi:hypothetical protein
MRTFKVAVLLSFIAFVVVETLQLKADMAERVQEHQQRLQAV